MTSEARPVFREGLDEPGHSENGEHAFRRSAVEEVISQLGDARDQPSLILRLWRPEEDRVVA